MAADFEFKGYDNCVIGEQIESMLSTKLDMNRFMTADFSLAENPGMTKKIHRYHGTGVAEILERGEGNSELIDAEYTEDVYTVARTQAQAQWYDDDLLADPTLIDAKIKYVSEAMINAWNGAAIKEYDKTENMYPMTTWELLDFANAISKYAEVYEDQAGLFFLVNIKLVPTIRNILGDNLMYTEAYIRTGAIGDILGVPIYTSKAVPENIMYLATPEAVTAYIKKGVGVEQDRDIDKKKNFVVASRYAVIALTDESKCIKCGMAQEADMTAVADVSEGTVAGACAEGSVVYAYDAEGKEIGHANASGETYSISGFDGKAGDVVKVIAKLEGYLPQIMTIEAQA